MRVSLGRHFFQEKKNSGRNLTKNVKFPRAPSSKLFRSLGKKIQPLKAKRKLYQPVSASHQKFETRERKKEKRRKFYQTEKALYQKFETKERKKKRELWIQTSYWHLCKKLFWNVQFFFVLVQCWMSPFEFPIVFLSFCFIFYITLWLLLGEICAISVEMYLLNLFPSE